MPDTSVSVRYIVDDVDAAVTFYSELLGFDVVMRPDPRFAMLSRGPLRLLLNSASGGPGGAAQPMPDGRRPEPGGWNRVQVIGADLAQEVDARNVDQLIKALDQRFPGIGEKLSSGTSVAINGEIIPDAQFEPVPEGAEIHFLDTLSGG
jgi:catechol 2,3-dioxygenase-like lactoylglutathione lyase family enzyme